VNLKLQEDILNETEQEAQKELCAQDIWEFAKFCWTYDAKTRKWRKFPTDLEVWGYLDTKVFKNLRPGRISQFVKHRQLLISWFLGGIYPNWEVYRALRYGWVWDGAAASIGLQDAMEVFNRFNTVRQSLPDWLKEAKPYDSDYLDSLPEFIRNQESVKLEDTKTAVRFAPGISYRALPTTPKKGRGWTYSYILFDDASYNPHARSMFDSLLATLGEDSVAAIVATRNGRHEWFAECWFDEALDWDKVELRDSDIPGRDEAWLIAEAKRYPDQRVFQREHGDNWDVFRGKPVFPMYEATKQGKWRAAESFKVTADTVIYLGVDFGFHYPYCCWAWIDQWDRLCFIKEFMGREINTDVFWNKVVDISQALFPGCMFKIYCDPAGAQTKDVSRKSSIPGEADQQTDVDIIRVVGKERGFITHPEFHFSNVDTGVKRMRIMLGLRDDGMYGMMVDALGCPVLSAALAGGLRYPEDDDTVEKYEKDGFHDHAADGARMIVANRFEKPKGGIKVAPTQRQVVGEPTSAAKARRNVPTGPRIVRMAA
jgi:hypothetical protein